MKELPIIEDYPEEREIEYLVAMHFATIQYGGDIGIPDAFVFKNDKIVSVIELTGYIFSNIEDLRSHSIIDGMLHVDVKTAMAVHEKQPDPYAIIEKKSREDVSIKNIMIYLLFY